MLPTVERPGDFPVVELGDVLDRAKQEVMNEVMAKVLHTFLYKGFSMEKILDAIAEFVAKNLNNQDAIHFLEGAVRCFQVLSADQEVKSYRDICGRGHSETESLEGIRQEHESFLSELEALAVQAIAMNDWSEFHDHIDFNAPQVEADTKDLHRPGAGSSKTTEVNERKD
jgi:uncharacterized protein YqfB (UPF0267 family)